MSNAYLTTRRAFAGGLVGAALVAGSRALGQSGMAPTPESAMGPFYPVSHPAEDDADMVRLGGHSGQALGQVIQVSGRLLDRHGNPIRNGRIDVWQANAAGRYAHPQDTSTAPLDPNFQGFARLRTGANGEWRITTVRPSGYNSPIGNRPPHIHFDAAGRSHRLVAQMYFPEEATGNAADMLYRSLGGEGPRSVAALDGPDRYRWNIVLIEG